MCSQKHQRIDNSKIKTENKAGLDFTNYLTFLRFIEKIQYDKVIKKRVFQNYDNNLSIFCEKGGKKIFW